MDLRKLKTLIDLVSESNVSELEITEAEARSVSSRAAALWCSSMFRPPCRPQPLPLRQRPWRSCLHRWLRRPPAMW